MTDWLQDFWFNYGPPFVCGLIGLACVGLVIFAFSSEVQEKNREIKQLKEWHCRVVDIDRSSLIYACDGGRYMVQ